MDLTLVSPGDSDVSQPFEVRAMCEVEAGVFVESQPETGERSDPTHISQIQEILAGKEATDTISLISHLAKK